jgi:hypothetical protein
MVKLISYSYKDSPHYSRNYVTTSRFNLNGNRDLVIDFVEEYLDPSLVIRHELDDGRTNSYYTQGPDEIRLIQERKCTVVMRVDQAVELARRILDTYGQEGRGSENN